MPNLSELRISLAAARVTLRQAKDELETAKAFASRKKGRSAFHNYVTGEEEIPF